MSGLKGQGNAFDIIEELQGRKSESEQKSTSESGWNELNPTEEFPQENTPVDPQPAPEPKQQATNEPYQGAPEDWNFKMNGSPQDVQDLKKETIEPSQMDWEKIEKQNRLYAKLSVEVGVLVLQYGTMALAGEFNEKGEKMFKISKEKRDELTEHTYEVLMLDADKPKNPKVMLIYLGVGISLPMLILAGKMRFDKVKAKKKEKKEQAEKKATRVVRSVMNDTAQEAEEIPSEIQEREDRKPQGRKTGMKKNPHTKKMEMYLVYDPEFGPVYSWDKDKLQEIQDRLKPTEQEEEEKEEPKKGKK